MDEAGTDELIISDVVHDVADQIRDVGSGKKSPVEPLIEPRFEIAPALASAPRPTWKQREQERVERQEQLRLAQAIERRIAEEIAAAERAEVRKAEERQREREAAERREQQRLVQDIGQQRRAELWFAARVQAERQRAEHFAGLQQIVDDLNRAANPPPPIEQPDTPPFEEGTGRLGYSDFNPALMSQPLRWW